MIVDIQFNPGTNDWPVLRDAVLQAEADGYDTTWVFDHFDGTVMGGDRPMLECCTLLGALAASTTTIGLGTLVVNVANRHPAVLAAAVDSVQRISNGRLRLGIGAGAAPGSKFGREHADRGIELRATKAERHAAVTIQIEALRMVAPTPVIVGVNSTELAGLAGQLADGINVRLDNPKAAALIDAALEHSSGRQFEISAYTFATAAEVRDRAMELGVTRIVETRLGPIPQ